MANDLFQQARDLNLPQGEYVLFGSAPLGIRGIRESHDIDIVVTPDLWDEYSRKPEWKMDKVPSGNMHLAKGDIEMVKTWGPGIWDIPKLIAEADVIDSLPFVRLETVLEWKRRNGREKDLNDVKLIEAFISRDTIQK